MADEIKKYEVNLINIEYPAQVFEELKKSGLMPMESGENLDALYDILTSVGEPTELILSGVEKFDEDLRTFLGVFRQVLEDAECENSMFTVSFD